MPKYKYHSHVYRSRPRTKDAARGEMLTQTTAAPNTYFNPAHDVYMSGNETNEYKMFRWLYRTDGRARIMAENREFEKDILQEIRFVLIKSDKTNVNGVVSAEYSRELRNEVMRSFHRLAKEFGLSKTSGTSVGLEKEERFQVDEDGNEFEPHDTCVCGYDSIMPELCECELNRNEYELADRVRELYRTHDAETVCGLLGVECTQKIRSVLSNYGGEHATNSNTYGKGVKRGGKRLNAGRKNKSGKPCNARRKCKACGWEEDYRIKNILQETKILTCRKCGTKTNHIIYPKGETHV